MDNLAAAICSNCGGEGETGRSPRITRRDANQNKTSKNQIQRDRAGKRMAIAEIPLFNRFIGLRAKPAPGYPWLNSLRLIFHKLQYCSDAKLPAKANHLAAHSFDELPAK